MAIVYKEKRACARLDLHTRMRYSIRGYAMEADSTLTDNISAKGLAFNTNRYLAPTTPLMLEVDLLSRILHPIGKVAWCQALPHSNINRLGVEFMEIDPVEKRYLNDYMNMQTGRL